MSVYFAYSGSSIPFTLSLMDAYTVIVTPTFSSSVNYNELITVKYNSLSNLTFMLSPSINISATAYFMLSDSGTNILKYYNYVIKYAMIALQVKALLLIFFGGGKFVSPVITFMYLNLIEVFKFINMGISPPIDDFLKAVDSDLFSLVQYYINEYLYSSAYWSVSVYEPLRFAYFGRKVYLFDYFGLGLIIFGLAFFTWVIVKILKLANMISESNKFYMGLEWNVLLSIFYSFSLKILLASTLQVYNYNFDDLYSILNTSLSIFFLGFYLAIFLALILKTLKVKRIMELSGTILGRDNIYFAKRFRLLFHDFNVKDPETVWYFQIQFFRYFLIVPCLIWCQSVELLQFFAFLSGNLIMLIYLIKFRPFKEKLNTKSCVLNEIIILLMLGMYAAFYNLLKNSTTDSITYAGFVYMGIVSILILSELIKGSLEIIFSFLKLADDKRPTPRPLSKKIYPANAKNDGNKEQAKDYKV